MSNELRKEAIVRSGRWEDNIFEYSWSWSSLLVGVVAVCVTDDDGTLCCGPKSSLFVNEVVAIPRCDCVGPKLRSREIYVF